MAEPFDDLALRAAINLLRDSIESGRMPSGIALDPAAADLHRQAADHLDTRRRQLGGAVLTADLTAEGRDVHVAVTLTPSEAWNLAQFLKRVGFSDFRTNAQNDEEAYGMRDASDRVRRALADAGYAPR